MKPWIFRTTSLGLALSALPFIAGSDTASSQSNTVATSAVVAPAVLSPASVTAPTPPPGATDKPLPAGINPIGPAADIVKLAQAGVNEDVMLAFVNNTGSAFNLGSQEIIYLSDLGVPDSVVKAMIQRDQALNSSASPAPPAPPAPESAAAAAPPDVASQTPPPPLETQVADTAPPPPDMQSTDAPPQSDASASDPSYDDFYNSLSPYGSWVDMPDYGLCWQPCVVLLNAGWQPYCDRGRWLYSDCGWYWHSDYTWGSVAFHYGRWFHDARRGWCWSPDRIWGPAWVSWRYNNSYCGWAALPPAARFHPGVGISGGLHADLGLAASSFTFVPWAALGNSHPAWHRLPQNEAADVFNHTSVINDIASGNNHTVINRGIDPGQVARITHREIPRVDVHGGHDGLVKPFTKFGNPVVMNTPNRVQPAGYTADQPSAADIQAYGSVGAIQRSYVPRQNAGQDAQPVRSTLQPLIIHGNYTPSSAAAAGWTGSYSRNVTVIGQSFAPPHNNNPYVTYATGPAKSQAHYEAPAAQNYGSQSARLYSASAGSVHSAPAGQDYAWQSTRYYSPPTQIYTPASVVPVPRYENSAPAYSYSPPESYSQPSRQQTAPARSTQNSYSSGGGYSRGNGYNH